MIDLPMNRRSMLRHTLGGVAVSCLAVANVDRKRSLAFAATSADVSSQLRGPILSIPTPFTKELAVDYDGVRTMIARALPHDIRIFSLTSGNSQYASLDYEEIKELTRVMIEAAGPNAVTIAATDDWPVAKSLEYADFAKQCGASALQVMKTEQQHDAAALQMFQEIAAGTNLPIILHGNFSHALLDQLVKMPSVIALKEDVGLEYYIQVQRKYGDQLVVFEGGPEYAYLVAYPYGSKASYTTLGTFAPQLTKQLWELIDAGNLSAAYEHVIKYEHPFFDHWSHGFWRASMEHFGVAQRYLRSPETSFTDDEMKEVAAFYAALGMS
jgi:dihydrodipicolinate synthase/N-acetylneuraminate lyase